MRIDDENKVVELLEIYKDDMAELKSDRGTSFPVQEARRDIEIAYKEMFIKDLERAINYKPKQPQKYYWRKKKDHLASWEDEQYLFADEHEKTTVTSIAYASKFDETELMNVIGSVDFDKFEKVECG